jgi:hypothetical protein
MDIQAIRFVFRDPSDPPSRPASLSLLYLLRRDLQTCMGVDLQTKRQGVPEVDP